MQIGLNVFPLGILYRKRCSVCADIATDFTCSVPIIPSMQDGKLVAGAPVGHPIEIYSGGDALNVSCEGFCAAIPETDCLPLAYGRTMYSFFIHNGNVYVVVRHGRDGESFTATATFEREYVQEEIVVSVRIIVRK